MAHRRPSTANDAGPSRFPFASAEALLWGPEMKKQHAYLLTEMRALQKQCEGYDARIRATEAVAEAAEAVTAQVRHLEQQLAAIQAKGDDRAFEKWASGEITRLNVFVDANKDIRQRQVELGTEISHLSENMDRFLRNPMDFESVLRRLALLEHERREDARRIQSLEREVNHFRFIQQTSASSPIQLRTELEPRRKIREEFTLAQKLGVERSGEIDDEEILLPWTSSHEEIHISQSPGLQETNTGNAVVTSPTEGRSIMSARWRLLQRPSIHDPKLPRPVEEQNIHPKPAESPGAGLHHTSPPPTQLVSRKHQHGEPISAFATAPAVVPVSRRQTRRLSKPQALTSAAPATQLVDRNPPKKRKQLGPGSQTQRQTRSQAKKNQVKETELQAKTEATAAPETQSAHKIEPISPPRKKFKAIPVDQRAGEKFKSSEMSQATSKSTRKIHNQCKVEEPCAEKPVTSTKTASKTTRSMKMKATASSKK